MKTTFLIYLLIFCTGFASPVVFAQLSIPASGLTVKSGTTFSVDSLAFIPSSDFTMTSVNIQKTNTPVGSTSGGASINLVYNLSNALSFSGTLRIYYNPAGLNSNTESMLQFASSPSWTWTTTTGSTVNNVAHYVEKSFAGLSFQSITATEQGITLPLVTNSLSARLNENNVDIQWQVNENNLYKGFVVEASKDGGPWQQIGFVPAEHSSVSITTYHFIDYSINFIRKQYRVKLEENIGRTSYSTIVLVKKGNKPEVLIKSKSGGADIDFMGSQPNGILIFDLKGGLVKQNGNGQARYEVNGLLPGVYVLSFSLKGVVYNKQFIIAE